MEAAGVVIGIISLYQAVIKIIDHAEAYKNIGLESRVALIHFEAAKSRLQDWACDVGIRDGRLAERHDSRLDDAKRVCVIKDTLECLRDLCEKVEKTQSSIKLPMRSQRLETDNWSTSLDDRIGDLTTHQTSSKRSRLVWAAGGREKLSKEIILFEGLVNTLYHVIDPNKLFADSLTLLSLSPKDQEVFADETFTLERIRRSIVALDSRDIFDWLDASKYDDEHEKHISMHQDGTFAYCFSSSHAPRGDELDSVIRTWITQIARDNNGVLHLCQNLRSKQNTRRASGRDVWILFKEISVYLKECIFVLDGLDEFRQVDDNRTLFIQQVKEAVGSTGAKILITSRNEVDIASELTAMSAEVAAYTMLECKISKDNVEGDVSLFSRAVVDKKFPKQDASFRQELSGRMAERAGGMFLWIKLQQSQLRGSQNRTIVQRTVENMPQGLYQTYDRVWGKINELAETDWIRAVRILRWLTFTMTPLTVQEVIEALIIDDYDYDEIFCEVELPADIDDEYVNNEIKALCYSFIEVEESALNLQHRQVYLSHASVRDYLIDKLPAPLGLQPCPVWNSSIAAHRAVLATHCLLFLDSSQAWVCDEDGKYHAFTSYATQEWPYLALQSREYHGNVADFIHRFLNSGNTNFKYWRTYFESNLGWVEEAGSPGSTSPLAYACHFRLEPTIHSLIETESQDLNSTSTLFGNPLQIACRKGLRSVADHLLSKGADLTIRGGPDITAINAAVRHGQYDLVELLLDREALIGLPNPRVQEATRTAIRLGLVDIFEVLLDKTLIAFRENDPDKMMSSYVSEMLNASADYGNTQIAETLVTRGADPNSQNANGVASLHLAASANHIEFVRFLLDHGASVDGVGRTGATSLSYAAVNGHLDVITILLEYGAAIDAQDRFGYTALRFALEKSRLDMAKSLLNHNLTIDALDNWGSRALHTAARKGFVDIIRILLDKGADLNLPTASGETPLGYAARIGQKAAVELLHQQEAGVNSGIAHAIDQAKPETTRSLIEEANISVGNASEATSDHIAILTHNEIKEQQRLDILDTLLQSMDISSPNHIGFNPLHYAARRGYNGVIELLLDLGYNINTQDVAGLTPLSLAVAEDHINIAKMLLHRGADPNATDDIGIPSLSYAVESQAWPLVSCLLEKGCDCNLTVPGDPVFFTAIQLAPDQIIEEMAQRGADFMTADEYGMTGIDWIKRLRPQLLASPNFPQKQELTASGPDYTLMRRKLSSFAASLRKDKGAAEVSSYQMSKKLLILGMDDDARLAFQYRILPVHEEICCIECDGCDKECQEGDRQTWYTCKLCPDIDLCQDCFATYEVQTILHVCRGHPFLEIINFDAESQHEPKKNFQAWLKGLEDRLNSQSQIMS
ncbi:MAG: hypothetical protein Q9220_006697 [cf. Caloplaca sp. 1 TL-2023]